MPLPLPKLLSCKRGQAAGDRGGWHILSMCPGELTRGIRRSLCRACLAGGVLGLQMVTLQVVPEICLLAVFPGAGERRLEMLSR